jgi:hypothetical protein
VRSTWNFPQCQIKWNSTDYVKTWENTSYWPDTTFSVHTIQTGPGPSDNRPVTWQRPHTRDSQIYWRMHPLAHVGSWHADFSTLKMEAIRSSETSVHTRSTWRHIPADGILHSHRRKNLKSYVRFILYKVLADMMRIMEAVLLVDIHAGIAGSIPDLGVYVYTLSVASSHRIPHHLY